MGFLSRFRSANRPALSPSQAEPDGDVQDARQRARRRLIGAALLLGAGVVAFPLLFETQPRPVPVDVVLDIPDPQKAAPLVLPKPASPVVAPVAPLPKASTPAPAPAVEAKPEPKPEPKPAAKAVEPAPAPTPPPVAAAPTRPADTVVSSTDAHTPPKPAAKEPAKEVAKEPAKDAINDVAAKDAASDTSRYVVQVGAFAEGDSARSARQKVEALGLKTYTQEVSTAGGKRIRVRVGPYAVKADAQKAADRIKASGLPAAVLTL